MKKNLLYLFVAMLPLNLIAQQKTALKENLLYSSTIKRCLTYEKMQELRALDPVGYDQNKAEQEQAIQNWITKKYQNNAKVIYTIPVVVQIFGTTPNNSVTDNRVFEQLAVLNADYRRLNSDTSLTASAFKGVAADCEIEFCLATKDPQGNTTTGIVRKTTPSTPSNSDLWNTSQYLNLLVYTGGSLSGGILGFTYLPSQAPNNGVHINYQYFGKTGTGAPYNKGRTASHEVGHWFNLEHIWGDSNCGNDLVSDTPTQQAANYGCPSFPHITCSNGPNGDMFMNYMDYSDDGCMNMFSAGQKARMISAINQYRPGLLNNGKCGTPQPTPPTAAFSANPTTVIAGSCVNFTDQSTGVPTSWAWSFPGAVTTSSTQQNPSNICYNDTGCYNVTLIATNTDGSDTMIKTCYINVIPLSAAVCDTVSNYKPTDTPSLYGSDNWGYVTGHNGYDDRAKADFFSAPPSGYEITGAKFWFAKADPGSGTSTVDIKIWADNAGTPGSVLYSQTVLINTLQVYPQETFINFTSPQTITGNYYLGVEFAPNGTPQDTVALISSADGETNPCPSWEKWNDGTWYNIDISWGGVKIAQAIWALLCPADTSGCPSVSVSTTTTNVSCNGGNDGTITANPTGGAAPYSYTWSNGSSTATISNLSAGTYSGTATDANGCDGLFTASITAPTAISGSATTVNASCGSSNGSATVSASGGTPGYSYLWSNGPTGTAATGLAAGNYSITITDSKNCTGTVVASVSNTNAPVVLTGSTDASVYGACDGSASANATGGTTPYNYLWSNGATTSVISGLCAGTYNVTVTDGATCSGTGSAVVSQPVFVPVTTVPVSGIQVFPNPNSGRFTVTIPFSGYNSPLTISVYNILGEKIISEKKEQCSGERIDFDLSNESKGIYFVEIKTSESTTVKKISLIR